MHKPSAQALPSFSVARPTQQGVDKPAEKQWTIEVHKTSAATPSQRLKERAEAVRQALNCSY